MMGLAVFGSVTAMVWLLWLASGVMDSWASKENLDELPRHANQIGYTAVICCCCTLFAVAGHALAASGGDGRKHDLE